MDFNDGSLSIAAFGTSLSDSGCTFFIYDSDNNSNLTYVMNQRNHIMGLLDAAYFEDDNVTDYSVVTWNHYTYCETHVSIILLYSILTILYLVLYRQ